MKDSQKAEFEKVRFRNLEGKEIRGQLSKGHPKMESQQKTFGKKAPKEENYEKQRRDQPPKLLVQHGLWYLGEQRKGISGTLET